MFKDEVEIKVQAGKGGDGMVSFRREKTVAKGGPDGGDGGRGGNVYLRVNSSLNSLFSIRQGELFQAGDGGDGQTNKKHGKKGEDCYIEVPRGTMAWQKNSEQQKWELLGDLVNPEQTLLLARGGKGGLGNVHFATPSYQAPRIADRGAYGEKKKIKLELKLIADVGIIGFPNAGKSTLISVISNAKVKIANYPFTTLSPNLGVVRQGWGQELLVADIPGLIKGAHRGKGLGDRFLKHIERTSLLIHLIDIADGEVEELKERWQILNRELSNYSEKLQKKNQILVFNKIDLIPSDLLEKKINKLKEIISSEAFFISAASHEGVDNLLKYIFKEATKKQETFKKTEKGFKVFRPHLKLKDRIRIFKTEEGWIIKGRKVEEIVQVTDTSQWQGLRLLFQRLEKTGLVDKMEKAGIQRGDQVTIGEKVFIWE